MTDLGRAKSVAIAAAAQAELARRSLLDFAALLYPGWQNAAHLDRIASLLEAVERGDLRRLMVNLPPRHGKSVLVAQIFPAWYLGRNPRGNVIEATHGAELAERNSRGARALIQDERWPFASRLSLDSTSAARWNLLEGGGMYACGVDSSITGRGADVLILDDLQHDSGTEGEREAAWRWYCEIAVPRLEPGASIIAIGTRFAEDDLFGRLLDGPDADEWSVLRLPAFAEDDDPLGRAPGDALWPERISATELEARKRSMGSRWFACQFQQNPLPSEGNIVKASWLQSYEKAPDSFEKIVCALDAASKTGVANDYSAIVVLGARPDGFYLLDVLRRKVEYPELLRMVQATFAQHNPSAIYIEDASAGTALIQNLRRESNLPIVPVKALGSKVSRVEGITGLLESGRVFFPKEAPWLVDFERELLAFPNAKHDDMVDAFVMALAQVIDRPFVYAESILPTNYDEPESLSLSARRFLGIR
ncbi:MAG: phage terminase large subunit [Vulcanimicrobiaceae bacterium]